MTKILIVDDEEEITNLLRLILETQQYDTITARHGIDAIQCYEENHPDLIITDLTMPSMGGIELIQRIRSKNAAIPILVISGNLEVDGIPLHNLLMLQKPISMKDIFSAITQLMSLKYRPLR